MASLEPFFLRVKPALDAFLRNATKENLKTLENELSRYNWTHMSIFNIQILVPLVLKLEELRTGNQEIRTGCLHCITFVTSKVYIKELKALRTMLLIALKQVREDDKASTKPNLSEEIKLATVKCVMECFKRSTSDVLEQFYTRDAAMILGQILLTLVEFIEKEKYKKLLLNSLECLMIVFYVHEEADRMDVVLRNQVANTIFIFLPKIVSVLCKISVADDTLGESIKAISIKAMGRILCLICEETSENLIDAKYDVGSFKRLLREIQASDFNTDNDIFLLKKDSEQLEKRLAQLQEHGRTQNWMQATSKKLRAIFTQIKKLRSHNSTEIRENYAEMCCLLIERCSYNLKENFLFMLESVVALSEDENLKVRNVCCKCIKKLQKNHLNERIFIENSELLLDEHLTKLPRIIARYDDDEQYSEFTYLKGLFKTLSAEKLQLLLSIPHNLEMLCMCLLSAIDLQTDNDLLIEEYSLREIDVEADYLESNKMPWRKFTNLSSERSVQCLHEICGILGSTPTLNRMIVDYLLEMLQQQSSAMNEIILMLSWLVTSKKVKDQVQDIQLVKRFLDELLDDKHWHLEVEPHKETPLKVKKNSDWFVDYTPGLYESAVEIRTQNFDSDDEMEDSMKEQQKVSLTDVKFNVLHMCIVLDCLGNSALYIEERFDGFVFQALHKVLSKLAHSNSMIYKAANFALVSIQTSLRFNKAIQLIEGHMDYITYHLNRLLKKTTESKEAVDILTVVLQFSSSSYIHHLEVIFDTIYEECSKQCATYNTFSYLKVCNAFLRSITSWLLSCSIEIKGEQKMLTDDDNNVTEVNDSALLTSWLDTLNIIIWANNVEQDVAMKSSNNFNAKQTCVLNAEEKDELDSDLKLPRYILLIKSILQQVIKFLTSSDIKLQIVSLECLICGIPLLHDYENELLPLIHLTWPPLVEKFRQKNSLVLNRCFSLLEVLALNAKDFITKRCLSDVMPILKQFLQETAIHSARETFVVPTQKHKLQLKLIKEFPNVIKYMELDDKILNEISDIILLYLSEEQPKDLQNEAIEYFTKLRRYNGPLIYVAVIQKSYLSNYENNLRVILKSFDENKRN